MEIISNKAIDPSKVYELIKKDTAGSVVLHFAVVKRSPENPSLPVILREQSDRRIPLRVNSAISSMEFHANGDIKQELHTICDEILKRWKIEDVLIIRRLGQLNIGDIISLVAVSSPHREEAFDACRYGVDRLKKMLTITKKEIFV